MFTSSHIVCGLCISVSVFFFVFVCLFFICCFFYIYISFTFCILFLIYSISPERAERLREQHLANSTIRHQCKNSTKSPNVEGKKAETIYTSCRCLWVSEPVCVCVRALVLVLLPVLFLWFGCCGFGFVFLLFYFERGGCQKMLQTLSLSTHRQTHRHTHSHTEPYWQAVMHTRTRAASAAAITKTVNSIQKTPTTAAAAVS